MDEKRKKEKYLLVLTDQFSGWPEAFSCCTNKAREIVKILLKKSYQDLECQWECPLIEDHIFLQV